MKTNENERNYKANRGEKYWSAVPHNSEAEARKVAHKFGLKFATYIVDNEDGAETILKHYMSRGMVVLRGVSMTHGVTASIVYHA